MCIWHNGMCWLSRVAESRTPVVGLWIWDVPLWLLSRAAAAAIVAAAVATAAAATEQRKAERRPLCAVFQFLFAFLRPLCGGIVHVSFARSFVIYFLWSEESANGV